MKTDDNKGDSVKPAEELWEWLETLLRKIFIDAFVHGYKHGKDGGRFRKV